MNGDSKDALMTTPGEMVKCAAAALGVPEMTLTQIDRELVTNGLRTKGGRGRSAAKMNTGDVANLLIAAASGSLVKDTVQSVNAYAKLPGNPARQWLLDGFNLPAVQALAADHTFGEALCAFIETFISGEFDAALAALPVQEAGNHRIPSLYHLEFRLFGPYPQAAVRLFAGGHFREERHYNVIPSSDDDLHAWAASFEKVQGGGDLTQVHQFTHRTIRKLAEFLRGEAGI